MNKKQLEAEVERLRKALGVARTALDDWVCTYASDMVGEKAAEAAAKRVYNGGTLLYIAKAQEVITEALNGPNRGTKA